MPRLPNAFRTSSRLPTSSPASRLVFVVSLGFAASLLVAASAASAQGIDDKLWVTNGLVYTVTEHDGLLYIGGGFTRVSPATGAGVPVDGAGALPPSFPQVIGEIYAVAGDSTGWYIGGSFTSVGGVARANLARVNQDMTVSSWNPGANGTVRAIEAGSTTNVYIGGDFTTAGVGSPSRNHVAAIKKADGTAASWNPGATGTVYALARSDTVIYVGGQFGNLGGVSRTNAGAVSAAGNLMAWAPNPNGPVYALAVGGVSVFLGGSFSMVVGGIRINLAAVNPTSGVAQSPLANTDGPVYALVFSGGNIYAGGDFSTLGGVTRLSFGAFNASTGSVLPMGPSFNLPVRSLIVDTAIYVGGEFTTVNGTPRDHAAALNASNGSLLPWNPAPNDFVHALSRSGSFIYLGGVFTGMGGVARNNLAAIDPVTGAATAWNPNVDGLVVSIAAIDTTVYVGGYFDHVGGQARNNLASISALTGVATPGWAPDPDSTVYSIVVNSTSVYVGGDFHNLGGQPRDFLAKLAKLGGAVDSWNPNPDGFIYTMTLDGPYLYVGGQFQGLGRALLTNLARFVTQSGNIDPWAPNPDFGVAAIAVSGTAIYAGGLFTTIGGQPRANIAAIRADTGLALPWNPGADSSVFVLEVHGSKVYAGGAFHTLGGQPRNFIGCVNTNTGAALNWNPNATDAVYGIEVSGSEAYVAGNFKGIAGAARSRFAGLSVPPVITSVTPTSGGNVGLVTLTVNGGDFQSGASVRLTGFGGTKVGTGVNVATDGASVQATFDLSGAQAGPRAVVVVNPDGQRDSLLNVFTVTAQSAPQLRVSIIGAPVIRASHRVPFDLVVENDGNVDALAVPLWIAGIPTDAVVEVDSTITPPPQSPGEPSWSQVPPSFSAPTGQYVVLVLPRVAPGTTSRRFFLTVPASDPTFQLVAAVTPTWEESPDFDACLRDGGVLSAAPCAGGQLGLMNAFATTTPDVYSMSGAQMWAKIAWQCEAAPSLLAAVAQSHQALNFMLQSVTPPNGQPASCSAVMTPRWKSILTVSVVTSIDPNEKVGATGSVALQQAIPYSIRFENLTQATAPAQQVVISDPLDVTKVDPATVSLDAITFGSIRIVPPPGLRSYATQVDLRPGKNLLVNVSAAVDLFTGVLSWYFSSIDPATGQPPQNPLVGFLPPNHVPPEGEGSVLFTVLPKGTVTSGTTIHNHAAIAFDGLAPLMTAEWSNVVDGTPPASAVLPLPASQDSLRFTVRWAAQGGPGDLRDYTIYVSEDTGPYHAWRLNTVATADTFAAHGGHTYKYYSVARDANGNVEAAPPSPDAQTFSNVGVGDERVSWTLGLAGAVPNPARGQVRASIVLANGEPATLELIDVAGRRVFRRDVGPLGPGPHVVPMAGAQLRAGLYFLRLSQGARVLHARVAFIR